MSGLRAVKGFGFKQPKSLNLGGFGLGLRVLGRQRTCVAGPVRPQKKPGQGDKDCAEGTAQTALFKGPAMDAFV